MPGLLVHEAMEGFNHIAPYLVYLPVIPTDTTSLRIFTETEPQVVPPARDSSRLAEMAEAFRQVTGRPLQDLLEHSLDQPIDSAGSSDATDTSSVSPGDARRLASALTGLADELARTQMALRDREVELAASGPMSAARSEPTHLAARLESALKAGAEGIGCQAAALYLLDEPTTCLKLRACWGLPPERLIDPPRPLQDALADLEAMLGHAVVLEHGSLQEHFNSPENFPATVCVPVSTPATVLGTLWFFSESERDFSDRQTNVVELTAGRLAADLERETLVEGAVAAVDLKHQLIAAERVQRNQLPTISPLLDNWDVAGWTAQAQTVGGDFFDWFGLPDGWFGAVVGDVMEQGLEAALSASMVKAVLQSHGQYHREVSTLMQQANLTFWRGSAGDQFASIFCGFLETATGQVRYCCAGNPSIVRMRPGQWEPISHPSPPLGESPETNYSIHECLLQPGEALLVFTDGFRDAMDAQGYPLGEAGLADPMANQLDRCAQELVALARHQFESHATAPLQDDRTILVIKHTAS